MKLSMALVDCDVTATMRDIYETQTFPASMDGGTIVGVSCVIPNFDFKVKGQSIRCHVSWL